MTEKIIKLSATFFKMGYLPIPGTMASLGGLLIYSLINANTFLYLTILILLLIVGFYVCAKAEKIFNQKDSRKIVIDEVCGMLIALFLLPVKLPVIICAFFIFRALDTVKPPPIERIEKLSGGRGIMLDDIVAGIYTNLIIQFALKLTSAFAS